MKHKNIAEAIADTAEAVAGVRTSIDTEKRKAWIYVTEDTLIDWAMTKAINETMTMEAVARLYCGKPVETIVRSGANFRGKLLFAVWNGEGDTPSFEPEF